MKKITAKMTLVQKFCHNGYRDCHRSKKTMYNKYRSYIDRKALNDRESLEMLPMLDQKQPITVQFVSFHHK